MEQAFMDWDLEMFKERYNQLVNESGLSVRALAKAIGVSPAMITQWKTTNKLPNLNSVVLLSRYFNVSVDWILGIENENTRSNKPNIRNVAKLAGLSESAVQRLAYVQDADNWLTPDGQFTQTQWMPEDKKILSELISNDVLLKTVRAIQSYRANTRICIERRNIEEFGEVIEDSNVKGAKLAKFDVQEAFILYLAELRKTLIEEAKAGDPDGKTNQETK